MKQETTKGKFKVTLNMNEDDELREWARDLIRGQVQKLAREEINKILFDTAKEKLNAKFVELVIKETIDSKIYHSTFRTTVETKIEERINEYFDKYPLEQTLKRAIQDFSIKISTR